ncbi:MAG: hypothetical protein ACXWP4_19240 [Polyangiales bacterium]
MLRRTLLIAILCLVGCPKEEPAKSEEKSGSEEKTKKKKSADDDDDDKADKKKSKKKSADDDDDDKSAKKKDEPAPADEDGKGRKASIVPEGTPVPPGCAPDPSGILGAKPKLVTSAGQPGASMAIWQKEGEKKMAAITISADGKCYVDYLKDEEGPGNVAALLGMTFEKGAIQAVTGTTEKSNATIVGFKVTYTTGAAMDGKKSLTTEARFYGYVAANGVPYSCAKIPGEKGDRCAMYHKPLTVETSAFCKMETGGGPPVPSIAPGVPKGLLVQPSASAKATASAPPSTSASTAPPSGDIKCDGTPWCTTSAAMSKDGEHVYVRIAAGKPKACMGNKIGETWYFEENAWKKR